MGSQFGQHTSSQAPKGMRVIDVNVEVFDQLTVDGLDNLEDSIEGAAVPESYIVDKKGNLAASIPRRTSAQASRTILDKLSEE